MRFKGKTLGLGDLGKISEKAKASWDYFGFDHIATPDTLLGQYGLHGWRAVLSGSDAIIVVDENLDLNTSAIFPDIEVFILWLEDTYDDRI